MKNGNLIRYYPVNPRHFVAVGALVELVREHILLAPPEVRPKLAEIITRVQKANPHLVRGQNLQTWFDEMNKAFIAMLLIWNCLTAKSECYRDEQETRYIIMGVCALFDGIRKQHNGRNYVETPLPLTEPGNITEIIVGPDAPVGADAMVTGLLDKFGYPPGIPVVRSSC